jgi:3-isopropylmalate/(R)-2-methylmalate dehydratase small subunit
MNASANAFTRVTGLPVPMVEDNVDTDIIIPSREIKSVGKDGLADGLFAGRRYLAGRVPDPAFVLNQPRFAGSPVLLGGANFGCGSSREAAVWALKEFGIRAVIAPSFNPIFKRNCVRNFVLPALADAEAIAATQSPVTVDLASRTIRADSGESWTFTIEGEAADMLLSGRDEIDHTLAQAAEIETWRTRDRETRSWAYLAGASA